MACGNIGIILVTIACVPLGEWLTFVY